MERPDGEGTLENPIQLGAEGARRASAESLRQKDGADEFFACHLMSPESPFSGGSIFMQLFRTVRRLTYVKRKERRDNMQSKKKRQLVEETILSSYESMYRIAFT